jgi:hypothetical protein
MTTSVCTYLLVVLDIENTNNLSNATMVLTRRFIHSSNAFSEIISKSYLMFDFGMSFRNSPKIKLCEDNFSIDFCH